MSRSNRLRLRDVRAAMRLVGDCRELGGDPAEWRVVLVEGLRRSTHTMIGLLFEASVPPRTASVSEVSAVSITRQCIDRGWPDSAMRRNWLEHLATAQPGVDPFLTAMQSGRFPRSTFRREQLCDEQTWYRSGAYESTRRAGLGEALYCCYVLPGRASLQVMAYNRPVGDGPPTERERRLTQLVNLEIGRCIGRTLADVTGSPLTGLAPRLVRVLGCLLQGDNEKQVAKRLRLSPHTVHDYVTLLYGHFDTHTRAELSAACVRLRITAAQCQRHDVVFVDGR